MNQLDTEINNIIMQELGLEVGVGNRIVDQDTGAAIRFRGKDIVAPGFFNGRSVEFDPINNGKMVTSLFDRFLQIHSEESDIYVSTFYPIDDSKCIECRMSDQTNIRSGSYDRDGLRYTDIMIQLNGGRSSDLKKYDEVPKPVTVKKRGNGNGNPTHTKTTRNRKQSS
jgi:hypothetical protein